MSAAEANGGRRHEDAETGDTMKPLLHNGSHNICCSEMTSVNKCEDYGSEI